MNTCETHIVFGERPAQAPDGWPIYNAPRPLMGDVTWQGDFYAGVFYAAVDPQGERAAWMMERNAALHAVQLLYVDETAAFAAARAWIIAEFAGNDSFLRASIEGIVDDPDNRAWVLNFYRRYWQKVEDANQKGASHD